MKDIKHITKEEFIDELVNVWEFPKDIAKQAAKQLNDKKIYVGTNDFQGGIFGVGRFQNELEWALTALEWEDSDYWFDDMKDDEIYKFWLNIFKSKFLIDWIQETWEIEIKPINKISKEELKELEGIRL